MDAGDDLSALLAVLTGRTLGMIAFRVSICFTSLDPVETNMSKEGLRPRNDDVLILTNVK